LAEYLDREEAFLRERQEDEERWQRFQQTGQAIEQRQVMAWLDALAAGHNAPCPK
jgi:predicted transcriptional regulator